MSQFQNFKIVCPACSKKAKVRLERLTIANSCVIEQIDVNTGELVVSRQQYVAKPDAELTDDAFYCTACGEVLLNEHNLLMQFDDVLELHEGNEFINCYTPYKIARYKGVGDYERVMNCDKLASLLKAALPYLEKIAEASPNFSLAKRAQKALVKAGYLKPEKKS